MKVYLVITTINSPNSTILEIAKGCEARNINLIIVGDKKTPSDFSLKYGDYYSVEDQLKLGFEYAKICPFNNYVRKNIGYLIALKEGADLIIETDDDNIPLPNFWELPEKENLVLTTDEKDSFFNVYDYFLQDEKANEVVKEAKHATRCWPRGFPLECIKRDMKNIHQGDFKREKSLTPIQQDLANLDPDVDAVYRLTSELPVNFKSRESLALGHFNWSPFNSQNTRWFEEAFPLLYLPATCPFRMTDIWRSYIAQRIGWNYGWKVLFRKASVYQERNYHNLLNDFELEIDGYLNYSKMKSALTEMPLSEGVEAMNENLLKCYEVFIKEKLFSEGETTLLKAWLKDFDKYAGHRN